MSLQSTFTGIEKVCLDEDEEFNPVICDDNCQNQDFQDFRIFRITKALFTSLGNETQFRVYWDLSLYSYRICISMLLWNIHANWIRMCNAS